MHEWFKYLWDSRQDEKGQIECFECGKKMTKETWRDLSTCYSHILSKKNYPEFKGEEWNLKIVHPDCHNLYTIKPSKAKNQYKEYLRLKNKIKEG